MFVRFCQGQKRSWGLCDTQVSIPPWHRKHSRPWWHLQGSPLDPSMASSMPESMAGLLAGNPWEPPKNIRNPVGYLRISHHLRWFSLRDLFETPCLLGYVWSKTYPPGSSLISVEFVGSPGLQNKSQQRASAKTVIKQLMANQMCCFEKSRNHARLIQLIFWLYSGCWWYV